jgi:hypothetical protein
MRLLSALATLLLLALTAPAARATAPDAPDITLTGEPEPVFEWSRDACEPNDFTDQPARAFRTRDGVRLFASHFVTRGLSGPDGDHLRHDCAVAFRGDMSPDPADFSDFGWLISPYALGDGRVFALVHNEFQGHRRPSICPAGDYHACWENAVTWAMSEDDGRTFQAAPRGRRVIAALPWRYERGRGDRSRDRPGGYFNPTNIVAADGAYYALVWARPFRDQKEGACVLRTTRLDDPAAWRAWDGTGYTITFANPYEGDVDDPARHLCEPVGAEVFRSAPSSLVRDEGSGLFLALQASNLPVGSGQTVPGVWVSASRDLIEWSKPEVVWNVPVWGPQGCNPARPYAAWSVAYPALIDFASPTANFETVSDTSWLYFTRYRLDACAIGKDRSLWRVRVRIGAGGD